MGEIIGGVLIFALLAALFHLDSIRKKNKRRKEKEKEKEREKEKKGTN